MLLSIGYVVVGRCSSLRPPRVVIIMWMGRSALTVPVAMWMPSYVSRMRTRARARSGLCLIWLLWAVLGLDLAASIQPEIAPSVRGGISVAAGLDLVSSRKWCESVLRHGW